MSPRDAPNLPHAVAPRRRPLIMIGPTPPPIHGSAFATENLIEAVREAGAYAAHLETGEDDRPVFNTGTLDLINLYLGLKHVVLLIVLLARNRHADVHIPISQNRWAFARDAVFIWITHLARRRVTLVLYGGLFGTFYAQSKGIERRFIEATFKGVDEAWVETPNRLGVFAGLLPDEGVHVLENTSVDIGVSDRDDGRDPNRVRLLFLANLIPTKGHGDLLGALEQLAEQGEGGFDLHLIGEVEDAEAKRVRERAEALAKHDIHVELLGTVLGERKLGEYQWADVLVLPSRYPIEGQPLVLLEGMSAGLPILSTDHSGIPFTVLDEQQGIIVPKGDIAAIAAGLSRLKADPDLRARFGRAGRARYDEVYSRKPYQARVAALLKAA